MANNAQWQNHTYQPAQEPGLTRQTLAFSEPDESITGWGVGALLDDGDMALSVDSFSDMLEGMPPTRDFHSNKIQLADSGIVNV